MNQKTGSYQLIDFPAERRAMPAFLELKAGRHVMYALLEADVTLARQFIAEHKTRTGETAILHRLPGLLPGICSGGE